jgi:hypothetical protein
LLSLPKLRKKFEPNAGQVRRIGPLFPPETVHVTFTADDIMSPTGLLMLFIFCHRGKTTEETTPASEELATLSDDALSKVRNQSFK